MVDLEVIRLKLELKAGPHTVKMYHHTTIPENINGAK